jgi:hypothetical protein
MYGYLYHSNFFYSTHFSFSFWGKKSNVKHGRKNESMRKNSIKKWKHIDFLGWQPYSFLFKWQNNMQQAEFQRSGVGDTTFIIIFLSTHSACK